jgi:hypothetical protein
MSQQDTIAWVAARQFLGDVWNTVSFNVEKVVDNMELDDGDETKDSNKPENNKGKATADPKIVTPGKLVKLTTVEKKGKDKEKGITQIGKQKEIGAKPPVSQFFLSKGIQKTNFDSNLGNTEHMWKHKFYIKTKLPKVANKDNAEAEVGVAKAYSAIIQRFFILTVGLSFCHGMTKNVSSGSQKEKLSQSPENKWNITWITSLYSTIKAAYCRMKVLFNVDEDHFFGDTD